MSATTRRDLALDPNTGDLLVGPQDLSLTTGIDAVLQSCAARLRFYMGEWFLDTSVGAPYYQDIFVKSPNINTLTAVLRGVVLGTEGIVSLTNFALSYDPAARTLAVTFAGVADFGAFDQQTVELTT